MSAKHLVGGGLLFFALLGGNPVAATEPEPAAATETVVVTASPDDAAAVAPLPDLPGPLAFDEPVDAAGRGSAQVGIAAPASAASEDGSGATTAAVAAPAEPEPAEPAPATAFTPGEAVHPDPTPTAAATLPLPPEPAPLTLTRTDAVGGALETGLADPRFPWPTRLARPDRERIGAFYATREYRPLWIDDGGGWNPAALALAERLRQADADGLDPADYPVPNLAAGPSGPTPADLAEADAKLSAAAFLYAHDARGGRLVPGRLSGLITPKLTLPAPADVLAGLLVANDPDAALRAYNPAYPGYRALRDKLAALRATHPATPVAGGSERGAGQRLAALGHDLPAGTGASRLEGDIVANMERWRWLPVEVAHRYILVNVPEFRVRVMADGRPVHEARVIVGAAKTPTPVFSGTLQYAVVNPTWTVPPSIVKAHPGLGTDSTYASRAGLQTVRAGHTVVYRQPPGPTNPLGQIKFMFPNDHAVYLHDTTSKGLFGSAMRAYSHGCVRVEHPFAFGGAVMGGSWTEARLRSLTGPSERYVQVAEPMPVHIGYFTVTVDEAGNLSTFGDIYGYNRRVRAALGLGA